MVETPERFGVLIRDAEGRAMDIIEKPNPAPSKEILVGAYFYTPDVFDIIKTCRPSARGELEVTDLNRWYIKNGKAQVAKMNGRWTDCGTFETLATAERMVNENGG
jgi:glucose-1-phosphate thymidylyltransferase